MKETKYKHYFADKNGIIYSDKSGSLKPLSQFLNNNGYYFVVLYDNGREHRITTHKLVAETFIRELNKEKK